MEQQHSQTKHEPSNEPSTRRILSDVILENRLPQEVSPDPTQDNPPQQ